MSTTAPQATSPDEVLVPLPEGARYDRAEGAWLVDGTPVVVNEAGTHYFVDADA